MHRTSLPTNGTGASSASATSALTSNGVTRDEDSKMREKLAALEDLNELLEEPVEEQVRFSFCNVTSRTNKADFSALLEMHLDFLVLFFMV